MSIVIYELKFKTVNCNWKIYDTYKNKDDPVIAGNIKMLKLIKLIDGIKLIEVKTIRTEMPIDYIKDKSMSDKCPVCHNNYYEPIMCCNGASCGCLGKPVGFKPCQACNRNREKKPSFYLKDNFPYWFDNNFKY